MAEYFFVGRRWVMGDRFEGMIVRVRTPLLAELGKKECGGSDLSLAKALGGRAERKRGCLCGTPSRKGTEVEI